jgi:predicted nucleic acid-binding protein
MLVDTDVIIWALRGNHKAAAAINRESELCLSVVSYMELLKGARDKRELLAIRKFLREVGFEFLPITASISQRAVMYMEEYALTSGLNMADALVAATAVEQSLAICTANDKHYGDIPDLVLSVFRP